MVGDSRDALGLALGDDDLAGDAELFGKLVDS
jgi:hypothetical protein